MTDITSVLSLQGRARRNARDQLALVRRLRQDQEAAARVLAELDASDQPPQASRQSG